MWPFNRTQAKLDTLLKGQEKIMTALENVQNDSADLIAKTDALLVFATTASAQAAALQARLDAIGNQDPELQAVADSLKAEAAKVAAFLTPPAPPAPAPAPAPTPAPAT